MRKPQCFNKKMIFKQIDSHRVLGIHESFMGKVFTMYYRVPYRCMKIFHRVKLVKAENAFVENYSSEEDAFNALLWDTKCLFSNRKFKRKKERKFNDFLKDLEGLKIELIKAKK